MNKIGFVKFFVLLICIFSLNVYGQRREISKQEFSDAYSKAVVKTGQLAYRTISRNEMFRGDEIKSVENNRSEFVPPNKNHYVFEIKMFDINKTFLNETVRIGDDLYEKKNGGNWTKQTAKEIENNPNKNYKKPVENNPKFYLTEKILLAGQTANLYESSVEHTFTNQSQTNQTKESTAYWKKKLWISENGRLLKMELEVEWQEEIPKRGNRRVWTYEYDPNIKIEAPILENKQKP